MVSEHESISENRITEGIIWKELLRFFFPILIGTFFQQSYHTIDAIIIGRFAGKEALGAIDATGSFIKLFINFFIGLSSGASVIIAQHFGAKEKGKVSVAVHTILAFSLVGGALIMIAGIYLAPVFFKLMSVPEDILGQAVTYARIYFVGTIPSLLYNIGSGILRAVGDSKRPFYYLMVSCILNVVLDAFFVGVLNMGVEGVGLGTIVAQAVSAGLMMNALMRAKDCYQYIVSKTRITFSVLKRILVIGVPIGIQSSMYSISNMFMQSGINYFGTNAVAAWAICGKMDFLVWMVIDTLGIAVTTFVAQNYGAGQYKRMRRSVGSGVGIAVVLIGIISSILYCFAQPIGRLFITDQSVITISTRMMRLLAPFYVTYIAGEILSGAIRGVGESFKPMLLTLIGTCGLRIIWILTVIPYHKSLMTVIMGYPFTWIVTSVMFIIYYTIVRSQWIKIQSGVSLCTNK